MITPSDMLDLNYYKVVSANLNRTLRFTFGASISRAIRRRTLDLTEVQHQSSEELLKLKANLDEFFLKFNRRLLESTHFELFDNPLDDAKQNLLPTRQLNFIARVNVYREMRAKTMNSMPYYDLPFNIKTDIDSALVNLEAQEFVDDLERASLKTRRIFAVKGSCLFFKDFLIATHLNKTITNNVYEFGVHFNLFNLTRNGNTNVFHIWREVHLGQVPSSTRHFMIIVIMVDFYLNKLI